MENIKVSVLIYVLNGGKYIERCVQSVVNQSLKEIEILLIDGGSTDGTLDILDRFAAKDERIKILHTPSGVGLQFNTGLKAAQGKYIGICESDDYLLEDMYQVQYDVMEKHQLDMLKADFKQFCQLGDREEVFLYGCSKDASLYNRILKPQEDDSLLKLGINGFWSGLYRREFLLDQKIFMNETKGASYQDSTFAFFAAAKARRAYLMKDAFYYYRIDNPDSSSNKLDRMGLVAEEYRLLKERLIEEGIFEKNKGCYILWKVKAHLWYYESLSQEVKAQYAKIMYEDLREEFEATEYADIMPEARVRTFLERGRESRESMYGYLQELDGLMDSVNDAITGIEAERSIVIFGVGNVGTLVWWYMRYLNKKVTAFCDNNQSVWGTKNQDVMILPPEEACRRYPDAKYIVANVAHYQDIGDQLKGLGIRKEDIIFCNTYEYFLKKVLVLAMKE